ncbi:MAG TPA: response regulator transcription factor [Candidatus Pseudomonas excrementavium]|uniref:Response regulator transcription factor n=1 Tax=Halopseudomonas bauzanensis TaxID=653930 RepID=A0A1I4PFX0_9GAMM|nr:response regulator transcription factor [Halopseudomonas bauzanensis]MCO5786670.1 DNA-binding response regulator [Pseudomonas sp. G11-1]MCO5789896.1 DNA-binding response regulator [Pseudomonas sp. G11-2]HIZ50189.1 response regulator transcription factor [Candidatus Pseudomonas excrementavium]TKA92193.1 response regulator transcription factor [Halopseudomonas bauzanensis]SES24377.1 two component transcriptional regulator, LuxR family [Halopseudomonas bauzanensis]
MELDRQQRVYVVDDDQGMLDSTVWLLESVGLQALPFTSGQAFLDHCLEELPACVLLDIRMPGMGGLAVQDALRERGSKLPVIFVSAHADVPIVVRAFRGGAVDFIEKPYNEQLLLDSVQRALRLYQAPVVDQRQGDPVRERMQQLTARERDVLLPLVQGYSNREIAEQLGISVKTVDLYRSRVMKRMQATSLPALVGMAIGVGLIEPFKLQAR